MRLTVRAVAALGGVGWVLALATPAEAAWYNRRIGPRPAPPLSFPRPSHADEEGVAVEAINPGTPLLPYYAHPAVPRAVVVPKVEPGTKFYDLPEAALEPVVGPPK